MKNSQEREHCKQTTIYVYECGMHSKCHANFIGDERSALGAQPDVNQTGTRDYAKA